MFIYIRSYLSCLANQVLVSLGIKPGFYGISTQECQGYSSPNKDKTIFTKVKYGHPLCLLVGVTYLTETKR